MLVSGSVHPPLLFPASPLRPRVAKNGPHQVRKAQDATWRKTDDVTDDGSRFSEDCNGLYIKLYQTKEEAEFMFLKMDMSVRIDK